MNGVPKASWDVQVVPPRDFDLVAHNVPDAEGVLNAAAAGGNNVIQYSVACPDGSYHVGVVAPSEGLSVSTSHLPGAAEGDPGFTQITPYNPDDPLPDRCSTLPPDADPPEELPPPSTTGKAGDDCKDCTAEPGFWEGLIPIWGSGKSAIAAFQRGQIGWGLFNTAMAVSDVFMVKALATAAIKGIGKVAAREIAEDAARDVAESGARETGEHAAGNAAAKPPNNLPAIVTDADRLSRLARELGPALVKLSNPALTGEALLKETESFVARFGSLQELKGILPESVFKAVERELGAITRRVLSETQALAKVWDVSSPANRLVLWSGTAESQAKIAIKDAFVLGETEAGSKLARVDEVLEKLGVSWPDRESLWRTISVRLAEGARGDVVARVRAPLRPGSVFFDEVAALNRNANATSLRVITQHGEVLLHKPFDLTKIP